MKTRFSISLLAVAVIGLLSAAAAQSLQLVKEWEIPLSPYNPGNTVSMCVDSVGNVHVITSGGMWSTLDPSGRLIRQTQDQALQGASSVACLSPESRVVVAVPKTNHLYIFSGDHQRLSSVTEPDGFHSVVSADEASIRLLAPHQGYLFKDVDPKTGRTTGFLGSVSQTVAPSWKVRGVASMDAKGGVLLFLTGNPETISAFDGTGKLMVSKAVDGDVRRRDDSQSLQAPGAPMTHDRAAGIFRIGNDRYLVSVNRVDIAGDRKSATSGLIYQILDSQFNVIGHASSDEVGAVLASDGEGTVYSITGGSTLTVAKAHVR